LPQAAGTEEETREVFALIEQKTRENAVAPDLDKQAENAVVRALFPHMVKQLKQARETISTLEQRVKDKQTKEPRLGDKSPAADVEESHDGDLDAAVADFFGTEGQRTIVDTYKEMGIDSP
jgi:hypothetical protein